MKSKLVMGVFAVLIAASLCLPSAGQDTIPVAAGAVRAGYLPQTGCALAATPPDSVDIAWLRQQVKATLDANRVTEVRDWNGRTEVVTYHAPSLDRPLIYPKGLPSWLRWSWRAWGWLCEPWGVSYPHQWFWDSCANAIVLSHFDIKEAEAEIDSLLYAQGQDGFLPHMIWNDRKLTWAGSLLRQLYPSVHESPYLHPPSLAEAVFKIYEQSGDRDFVIRVLPAVQKYYQYIESDRVRGADELPQIIISYESSKDRSPEYDLVYGESSAAPVWRGPIVRLLLKQWSVNWDLDRIYAEKWFQVKDAFFSSIYARNLSALAQLCTIAGQADDAAYFQTRANAVEDAILSEMYDPVTGLFYSLDSRGPDDKPLRVNTISSLMPLILNRISEEQVERLVNDHLLNPNEYWVKYPIPVEPASNSDPDPRGHVIWRGAQTWIFPNWYVVQGLRLQAQRFPEHREKYEGIADQLALKSYELVRQQGFREYYDANTGAGRGAEQFSWTTLILDMLRV